MPFVAKPTSAMPTMLTPPSSPRQNRSASDIGFDETKLTPRTSLSLEDDASATFTDDGTLVCPYQIETLRDSRDKNLVFGYGAWSTVFKATCHLRSAQTSGLATPPPSPNQSPPILIAVKKPARKDAVPILENEALILSRLMRIAGHERHVNLFHGVVPGENLLVLEAQPLSLEQHILSCAKKARENFSTANMSTPVVGSTQIWLSLAYDLITTLDWLHNQAMVVHGDIKPGNILLKSTDSTGSNALPFKPLFADFSSSQRLDSDEITANTLSAVTREYTAPELLKVSVLRDSTSTATTESDVFSLAVTLLVAASGNTMVYEGSVFQRQMQATQGWHVISCVRGSDQGSRVPKSGVVTRVLEQAVRKVDLGRVSAVNWKKTIEDVAKEVPSDL